MATAARFFDSFADDFDTFYDGKRSPAMQFVDWHFRRDMFLRFSRTFELLGDLSGKRVLDVGCGSGAYIAEALRRGAAQVTGIDPAPRMLALARRRVAGLNMLDRVRLVGGTFPETYVDERADYAIVMGVMDYVEDPARFLRALRDRISIAAVLSFPSRHWFRSPLRRWRYQIRRCPVYFYSSRDIGTLMHRVEAGDHRLEKIAGAGMDYLVCLRP